MFGDGRPCRRCEGSVYGPVRYELCDQCLDVVLYGADAVSDGVGMFLFRHGKEELDRRTQDLRREYAAEIDRISERLEKFRMEFLQRPESLPAPSIEISKIVEQVRGLDIDLIKYLKINSSDLKSVPPDILEHLVGELLAQRGFEDVRLVGRDVRTSADLYASTTSPCGSKIRFFVEVKRHNKKIGIQVVNQILGAVLSERPRFGWHAAILVSLGGFSRFRKTTHQDLDLLGLSLRDKEDLVQWLDGYEPNDNGLWLPRPLRCMAGVTVTSAVREVPDPGLNRTSPLARCRTVAQGVVRR